MATADPGGGGSVVKGPAAYPKKAGRMSPDMPVKYIRLRFVYRGPQSWVYGEWLDLTAVMRGVMTANGEFPVACVEFETKDAGDPS
jgi:hypothetical protein